VPPHGLPLDLFWSEHEADGENKFAPLARLDDEMLAARQSQFVKTCPAVVRGYSPIRLDPALVLQSLQRRIERSMIHQQDVIRLLLDGAGNAQTMIGSEHQSSEDQQVQRPLQQGYAFIVSLC